MARDFQAEHDNITERYYRLGNPEQYTPGQFIKLHDTILADCMASAGMPLTAEALADIDRRAIEADVLQDAVIMDESEQPPTDDDTP